MDQQLTRLDSTERSRKAFEAISDLIIQNRFSDPKPSLLENVILALFLIFGMIWGIPWITPAGKAVHLFFEGTWLDNNSLKLVAEIGTVITVGVDGLWIMLVIHRLLFPRLNSFCRSCFGLKQQVSQISLRPLYKKHAWVIGVSVLLAIASCVPSVYASYLYNDADSKRLAAITLFGNLGLATLGYYSLLMESLKKSGSEQKQSIQYVRKLQTNYDLHLRSQKQSSELPIIPLEVTEFEQFVGFLEDSSSGQSSKIADSKTSPIFIWTPLIIALIIGCSQSFIDIVLSKGFFNQVLKVNLEISLTLAIVFSFPNLFVSVISSRDVMANVLRVIMCKPTVRYSAVGWFYPRTSIVLGVSAFLLSLTAPASACFIVFTTIRDLNQNLATLATIPILIARVCFSNYTLRVVGSRIAAAILCKSRTIQDDNIRMLLQVMNKIQPSHCFIKN